MQLFYALKYNKLTWLYQVRLVIIVSYQDKKKQREKSFAKRYYSMNNVSYKIKVNPNEQESVLSCNVSIHTKKEMRKRLLNLSTATMDVKYFIS